MRNLLEDTLVDGVDSLSKSSVKVLMTRLGVHETVFPIGQKKIGEMEMINIDAEDQKRIDMILKIWNYFGPSEKNMGANH